MSLFKVVFLIVLLFGAYGVVVILLRRLTETTRQLGELREQMTRNNAHLSQQLRSIHDEQEKLQAQLEEERGEKSGQPPS